MSSCSVNIGTDEEKKPLLSQDKRENCVAIPMRPVPVEIKPKVFVIYKPGPSQSTTTNGVATKNESAMTNYKPNTSGPSSMPFHRLIYLILSSFMFFLLGAYFFELDKYFLPSEFTEPIDWLIAGAKGSATLTLFFLLYLLLTIMPGVRTKLSISSVFARNVMFAPGAYIYRLHGLLAVVFTIAGMVHSALHLFRFFFEGDLRFWFMPYSFGTAIFLISTGGLVILIMIPLLLHSMCSSRNPDYAVIHSFFSTLCLIFFAVHTRNVLFALLVLYFIMLAGSRVRDGECKVDAQLLLTKDPKKLSFAPSALKLDISFTGNSEDKNTSKSNSWALSLYRFRLHRLVIWFYRELHARKDERLCGRSSGFYHLPEQCYQLELECVREDGTTHATKLATFTAVSVTGSPVLSFVIDMTSSKQKPLRQQGLRAALMKQLFTQEQLQSSQNPPSDGSLITTSIYNTHITKNLIIRGPFTSNRRLIERTDHTLILASGTAITPVLSFIYHLFRNTTCKESRCLPRMLWVLWLVKTDHGSLCSSYFKLENNNVLSIFGTPIDHLNSPSAVPLELRNLESAEAVREQPTDLDDRSCDYRVFLSGSGAYSMLSPDQFSTKPDHITTASVSNIINAAASAHKEWTEVFVFGDIIKTKVPVNHVLNDGRKLNFHFETA